MYKYYYYSPQLAEFAQEKGWKCGNSFISWRSKCYKNPKTGQPLGFRYKVNPKTGRKKKERVGLTYQEYRKARSKAVKKKGSGRKLTDLEQRLIKDTEATKNKSRAITEKKVLSKQALSVGASQILPSGIAEAKINKLKIDPKRFQYKLTGQQTKSGTVGSLEGVKQWDPNLAGIIQVWQDPKDKQVYVVNGHNRVDLAKKLGVDRITAKFIKAKTDQEARSIGALTNIAEGRGNAQDAAKFFRDSGLTKDDLTKKGIPLKEKIATDGLALASLSDSLFDKVVQGSIPEQRAVVIGSKIKDHSQQQEIIKLIENKEKKGQKITNDTVSELSEMVANAPKSKKEEGGFFDLLGFSPQEKTLAVEKAQLQASIKRQLTKEKRLFGIVGKSSSAQKLTKAGNKINVDESAQISETASKALDAFDQEKNLSGKVGSLLNDAVVRIADGENSKKIEKEVYDAIFEELQKTYRFGKKEYFRRGQRVSQDKFI